jgi:hypothetical protein
MAIYEKHVKEFLDQLYLFSKIFEKHGIVVTDIIDRLEYLLSKSKSIKSNKSTKLSKHDIRKYRTEIRIIVINANELFKILLRKIEGPFYIKPLPYIENDEPFDENDPIFDVLNY